MTEYRRSDGADIPADFVIERLSPPRAGRKWAWRCELCGVGWDVLGGRADAEDRTWNHYLSDYVCDEQRQAKEKRNARAAT